MNAYTDARKTLRLLLAAALTGVALWGGAAFAEDVGALITFESETPALAAEVNQNLDDLKTAINSKQDRVSAAGMEFVSSATSQALQAALTTIASIDVDIPTAGFVVVDFDTQTFINHVTGSTNGLSCRLERDGNFLRVRAYDVYAAEQTGGRNRPFHITWAQSVDTPGSVTFTARCSKAGTATAQVNNWTLVASVYEHQR